MSHKCGSTACSHSTHCWFFQRLVRTFRVPPPPPPKPDTQKTSNSVEACPDLNMSLPIYQLCTDPPAPLEDASLQVMDQPAGTVINQNQSGCTCTPSCSRSMHVVQRQLRLRLPLSVHNARDLQPPGSRTVSQRIFTAVWISAQGPARKSAESPSDLRGKWLHLLFLLCCSVNGV